MAIQYDLYDNLKQSNSLSFVAVLVAPHSCDFTSQNQCVNLNLCLLLELKETHDMLPISLVFRKLLKLTCVREH